MRKNCIHREACARHEPDSYKCSPECAQFEAVTPQEHSDYYCSGGLEAIDFIDALNFNFNLGNVIKYITRAGNKKGFSTLHDLHKALWYLNHEIERLQKGKAI